MKERLDANYEIPKEIKPPDKVVHDMQELLYAPCMQVIFNKMMQDGYKPGEHDIRLMQSVGMLVVADALQSIALMYEVKD